MPLEVGLGLHRAEPILAGALLDLCHPEYPGRQSRVWPGWFHAPAQVLCVLWRRFGLLFAALLYTGRLP